MGKCRDCARTLTCDWKKPPKGCKDFRRAPPEKGMVSVRPGGADALLHPPVGQQEGGGQKIAQAIQERRGGVAAVPRSSTLPRRPINLELGARCALRLRVPGTD